MKISFPHASALLLQKVMKTLDVPPCDSVEIYSLVAFLLPNMLKAGFVPVC